MGMGNNRFIYFLKFKYLLISFIQILKSYGGFLSAMALFNEKSPFKCAVSGSPVTDWPFIW